jgi:hypothetical protein
MDTPATRRDAIASLLAMLAFVLGTSDSEAAAVSAQLDKNSEPTEYLDPASSKT